MKKALIVIVFLLISISYIFNITTISNTGNKEIFYIIALILDCISMIVLYKINHTKFSVKILLIYCSITLLINAFFYTIFIFKEIL